MKIVPNGLATRAAGTSHTGPRHDLCRGQANGLWFPILTPITVDGVEAEPRHSPFSGIPHWMFLVFQSLIAAMRTGLLISYMAR